MEGESPVSPDTRLSEIESKLDCCLILLGMLTTADGFGYDMRNVSPLWARAMSVAERRASTVSASVANAHPKCADETLMEMIYPMGKSASETAAARELGALPAQASDPSRFQCKPNPAPQFDYGSDRELIPSLSERSDRSA